MVILYTGEGKGKTTAALGLALRAVGYQKRVLMVQFGKSWFSGELAGAKKLAPLMKIIQGGKGFVGILGDKLPKSDHCLAAREAFDFLSKEINTGNWDIVIADEIVGAVAAKLLPQSLVVKLIKQLPEGIDLVLTGHHASAQLIDLADLVTEMKPIKHPFQKGLLAKKGIDY